MKYCHNTPRPTIVLAYTKIMPVDIGPFFVFAKCFLISYFGHDVFIQICHTRRGLHYIYFFNMDELTHSQHDRSSMQMKCICFCFQVPFNGLFRIIAGSTATHLVTGKSLSSYFDVSAPTQMNFKEQLFC